MRFHCTGLHIGKMWPMAAFSQRAEFNAFLQESRDKQSAKAPKNRENTKYSPRSLQVECQRVVWSSGMRLERRVLKRNSGYECAGVMLLPSLSRSKHKIMVVKIWHLSFDPVVWKVILFSLDREGTFEKVWWEMPLVTRHVCANCEALNNYIETNYMNCTFIICVYSMNCQITISFFVSLQYFKIQLNSKIRKQWPTSIFCFSWYHTHKW